MREMEAVVPVLVACSLVACNSASADASSPDGAAADADAAVYADVPEPTLATDVTPVTSVDQA